MNRREMLQATAIAIFGGSILELTGCGSNSSPIQPTNLPTSIPGSNTSSVTIDPNKVGQLNYSVTSPINGNLYFDVLPQLRNIVIGTHKYENDRVTGAVLKGYAVVTVNGDTGPEMINVLGEKTNVGWVVGIGNQHLFYNSIENVQVNAGDRIDFYYGLPCSSPYSC
ncbi:MAG TPA: hypothetical protein VFX17_03635 [Patescibacteria group bacterium]|nr:hypothetical protein [Patescibacteria group bacterium]